VNSFGLGFRAPDLVAVCLNRIGTVWTCALSLALVLTAVMPAAARETRAALVIGVANYSDRQVPKLAKTLNDSRALALARALRERGFQVRELADPGRREMMAAVNAFATDLARARVGLFYFSGHGVQLRGANYLQPRDVALVNRADRCAG
jgi:hypothetical protein